MIAQDRLKELLDYDPETGHFTWLKYRCGQAKVGDIAGGPHSAGYIAINMSEYPYLAHRLVWLWLYGRLPKNEIDHINHNRKDNRLCNLREVSGAENKRNASKRVDNKSGYVGICWSSRRNKWRANIFTNHKQYFLGEFRDISDAIAARKRAEIDLGFHPNHGS